MYNKVLVVSNMYPNKEYPSYGVFVKNFCDQLSEIGIKYDVSALTKTKNKAVKILKYGLFYVKTFLMCLSGKYDLVYIHYPSFSGKPVLGARKLKRFDIITNVHGTDVVPLKKEHERMLENTKKAIDYSKTVVVPSEYYKQLIIEKYRIMDSKVFVYPSAGVNESIFFEYDSNRKEKLREEYGINEATLVVGFVSRINKAKGWDVFIDAIESMQFPNDRKYKFFIVGSGEDDAELEIRIKGLPDAIRESVVRYPLLEQKKLADIYNLLDVFVFPTMSASESLGLVAIEAMACGCPVIASDYAAPKYYVIDGVNGYKFKRGSSTELNQRLLQYMNLVDFEALRNGALKTAEHFKKASIIRELKEVFNK